MRRNLRLMMLESRLAPAVATWDGGGTDANWTTSANWQGDADPQPGDDLVFPAGETQKAATNDFAADTAFNSLTINEAGYTIGGNAVILTAGITANIVPANPNAADAILALPLKGTGGLMKTGDGNLTLSAPNGYAGITSVSDGIVTVRTTTSFGAAGAGNGTEVAGGSAIRFAPDNMNMFVDLVVDELFTVVAGPGGAGLFDNVSFRANVVLTAPLTLAADVRFDSVNFSTFTLGGGVVETGGPHDLVSEADTVTFAAGTTVGVTGDVFINRGAQFDGAGPTVPIRVGSGGRIGGTGSVGPLQLVDFNELSPGGIDSGLAIGTLTTTGLSSVNTRFTFELGATLDRLVVNGPVEIGGQLDLRQLEGFNSTPGQRFRLIDNDDTDAIVGTFAGVPEGGLVAIGLRATYRGGTGNDFELIAEPAVDAQRLAVGAGAGGVPIVNVFNGAGALVRSFLAYDQSFRGGVRVAVGEFTGDLVPDVVTAPGFGGGPVIRIWNGETGAMVREFLAYDASFRGGVNLSTGFVDRNVSADIITGAGLGGGPHVKAFNVSFDPVVILSFFAYDANFRGGVSVAGGEATTGIGQSTVPGTVITGAGPGGGPHVRIFNAVTGAANGPGFFAYDTAFTGGVNVAYDRTAGPIITAPGIGGGPVVRGFDTGGVLRFQFLAYDENFRGGVTVAVNAAGPEFANGIVTGPGPGGGPVVRVWGDNGTTLVRQFNAFDPAFQGGVFVG